MILDYIVTLNQVKKKKAEWMLMVYIGLGEDRFILTSNCRKEGSWQLPWQRYYLVIRGPDS